MKTLIFLLISVFSFAQNPRPYVAFIGGIDARNAVFGSAPTDKKSELNYSLQFIMLGNNGFEAGIGFEQFNRIDFNRMYLTAGYQFRINEIKIIPTIEPGIINRYDNWGGGISYDQKSGFLTISGGLAMEYPLSETISVQMYYNISKRPDKQMMYDDNKPVHSFFLKIVKKIHLY